MAILRERSAESAEDSAISSDSEGLLAQTMSAYGGGGNQKMAAAMAAKEDLPAANPYSKQLKPLSEREKSTEVPYQAGEVGCHPARGL